MITFKRNLVIGMRCSGCAIAMNRPISSLAEAQDGDEETTSFLALCDECSPLASRINDAGLVLWSDVLNDVVAPFREWLEQRSDEGQEPPDEEATAELLRQYREALKTYEPDKEP